MIINVCNTSVVTALDEFGGGSGPIFMDYVQCLGNETHLIDCASSSRLSYCASYQHAGVMCSGGKLFLCVII